MVYDGPVARFVVHYGPSAVRENDVKGMNANGKITRNVENGVTKESPNKGSLTRQLLP